MCTSNPGYSASVGDCIKIDCKLEVNETAHWRFQPLGSSNQTKIVTVSWRGDVQYVSKMFGSRMAVFKNNTLLLRDVLGSDAGHYFCYAENSSGRERIFKHDVSVFACECPKCKLCHCYPCTIKYLPDGVFLVLWAITVVFTAIAVYFFTRAYYVV